MPSEYDELWVWNALRNPAEDRRSLVAATDLPARDLAMAFGDDGRRIGRLNLLSRQGAIRARS